MYELSAPQGFVYNKQLPSLGSILSQAQQMRVMAQRYVQERAKIAEQRAYDTTKDLYKFNANPAIEAFRPYMQNRTNELMGMAEKVRSGQLDPLELQKAMAMTQNELDHIAKGDKELKAQMDVYAKNGNRNTDAILKIVSDNTYSFIDTEINNGEPVTVPPLMWGPKYIIDKVDSTSSTYNGKAMSQKFVDYVKTNFTAGETVGAEGSPIAGTFTQVKTSGLPSNKYLGPINNNGNYTINVGLNPDGSNSAQTNELIGIWKANGKDYANYLELVAKEKDVTEGRALQNIMNETGHIAPKIERDLRNTPVPAKPETTGSMFIGGKQDIEIRHMDEAKEYQKLFSPDEAVRKEALDMFWGKGVENVSYKAPDAESENGYVVIKLDKQDPRIGPLAQQAPGGTKEFDGEFTIPLDPKRLKSLSSFANIVRPQDTNPTYLKQAFDKLNAPTPEAIAAFEKAWAKAKPGDEVKGPDGTFYLKQ